MMYQIEILQLKNEIPEMQFFILWVQFRMRMMEKSEVENRLVEIIHMSKERKSSKTTNRALETCVLIRKVLAFVPLESQKEDKEWRTKKENWKK